MATYNVTVFKIFNMKAFLYIDFHIEYHFSSLMDDKLLSSKPELKIVS
jgi:hypothetical protein